MEWLAHVATMHGERTVKKLIKGKPGEERKKGRSKLRWMDDVELDLRNMGVKRRRARTLDTRE
jgi:hypothetical protein